jgi:hypothetical protein
VVLRVQFRVIPFIYLAHGVALGSRFGFRVSGFREKDLGRDLRRKSWDKGKKGRGEKGKDDFEF